MAEPTDCFACGGDPSQCDCGGEGEELPIDVLLAHALEGLIPDLELRADEAREVAAFLLEEGQIRFAANAIRQAWDEAHA